MRARSTASSRVRHVAAGCAAAAVLLGGCSAASGGGEAGRPAAADTSAGSSSSVPDRGSSTYRRYVALGDSFTAAPYVPTTDLANGCLRSDGNYPALVAQRLRVAELVDVSCSAAQIRDLHRPQRTFRDTRVPAQLDAVTEDTDLVTVGIGGNDFDLFGTLVSRCTQLRPLAPEGSPCADQLTASGVDLETRVDRIGRRLERTLRQLRRRAPQARIVLVGYPRIAPRGETCPDLLPLADGDYVLAERLARLLDRAMSRAAERADVEFADLYAASRGHDVCSEHPWVNGGTTDQAAALAFHPFPAGMEAAADLVVDIVDDERE